MIVATKKIEPASTEQAQDLRALQAAVADEQAAPDPLGAREEAMAAAAVVSLADEIAGLVAAVVAVASPMLPSLQTIYTPDATATAAAAVAAVCRKHGWLDAGLMGAWSEEISCILICAPLALATVRGVRGDLERLRGDRKQAHAHADNAQPAPVQSGGSDTVSFGEPLAAA